MDEFLHRMWKKGGNPYFRAFGLFVIFLLAELGLVSTISDTGFSAEVQNYRGLVWVVSVVVALLVATIWLWSYFRRHKMTVFLRDAQDGNLYLRDLNGKVREIPDEDTYSFLVAALGALNAPLDMPSKEIDKLRGEKLIPIKKWERPLTPEERGKKDLWYKVSGELEKTDVTFEQNTSPQKITVQVSNAGKTLMHIKGIKFQAIKLSQTALPASYPKLGVSYVGIPCTENNANLAPGVSFRIELELRQKWQRSDIERIRGELGFLLFDIVYEGELVEGIIVSI